MPVLLIIIALLLVDLAALRWGFDSRSWSSDRDGVSDLSWPQPNHRA